MINLITLAALSFSLSTQLPIPAQDQGWDKDAADNQMLEPVAGWVAGCPPFCATEPQPITTETLANHPS
ncbi:hypothetical protein [Marichromatium bheemlicum]|uniref:Uncharacterized protein n=1 Tax=Marichromatium bheemlicum TaxID=365339 RepID=A0ABX1I6L7_9GAMM|nr:hypothetical protein [Marichromatium bheemlicum]NKN31872.1 hypothetical protein [Marichromatium bheemlicum]